MNKALKIKTMENVYGINKLNNLEGDNVLLYAPNGVMKSSLALAISNIVEKKEVKDRIFEGNVTKYELEILGEKIDDNNSKKIKNVLVFQYDDSDNNKLFDTMATLPISEALKKRYQSETNLLGEIRNLKDQLCKLLLKSDKYNSSQEKKVFGLFNHVLGVENWIKIISKLNEIIPEQENFYYKDLNALEFTEKGVMDVVKDSKFSETIRRYIQALQNHRDKFRLSIGLDYITMRSIIDFLNSKSFFYDESSGEYSENKLLIPYVSPNPLSLKELQEIIAKDEAEIKGLLKKEYDELEGYINQIEGKDGPRTLSKLIKRHISNIPKLNNLEKLMSEVLGSNLVPLKHQIEKVAKEIRVSEKRIKKYVEEMKNQSEEWEKILKYFVDRFHVPFEVKLDNLKEHIFEDEGRRFIFEYKFDGEVREYNEIKSVNGMLSTGERKALAILKLLFEIEDLPKDKKSLVILDDIVDSFDYKNKYAFVTFLNEILSKNKNINFWILTHNFDFYTTLISRFDYLPKPQKFEKKFAIKLKDEVRVENFYGEEISSDLGITIIKAWKNKIEQGVNVKYYLISLIPFLRNLVSLKEGRSPNFDKLTKLLHCRSATGSFVFNDFFKLYEDYLNVKPKEEYGYNNILDTLLEVASEIDERHDYKPNLEYKIPLAIACRVIAEKRLKELLKGDAKEKDKLPHLFAKYFKDSKEFTPEELLLRRTINEIMICAPELIHVNSFMYEPLVDISVMELRRLYKEINDGAGPGGKLEKLEYAESRDKVTT